MPLATSREEGCTEKCFLQYSENGSFMEKKMDSNTSTSSKSREITLIFLTAVQWGVQSLEEVFNCEV